MKYLLLIIAISMSSLTMAGEMDAKLDNYRATIGKLMKTLKSELVTAMKGDGPIAAIEVCNKKAPEITSKINKDAGFVIKRTSLKTRNADNAPDDWEKKVLAQFEERKTKGEAPKTLEFNEVVEADGKRQMRYMKAIPTGKPCTICHGETIAPPIQAKLKELYPDDQAIGFNVGDLRGAFSVTETITK
ncbi:DUF3365 domain-containing protein [Candidatus Halobeggiatoa sp. HSG11]|nr:DUF3365 domain-containing protein [Candidatus Halobeggiatoa sp. HSG11]